MADGRTHTVATVCVAAGAAIACIALGQPAVAIYAAGGAIVGVVVHPDLDQNSGKSFGARVLGPLQIPWKILWAPYAVMVPHRHWMSHAPVVGTIGRVLYLLTIKAIVHAAIARVEFWNILLHDVSFILTYPLWLGLIGLAFADLIHYALDVFPR